MRAQSSNSALCVARAPAPSVCSSGTLHTYEQAVVWEISGLHTVEKILTLLRVCHPVWLDEFSHALILVSKVGPIDASTSRSDDYTI